MKVYKGGYGFTIIVKDGNKTYKLKPKGIFSTGFCWGRGAPCASETAIAILSDAVGYKKANILHTHFKWDVVVKRLRKPGWVLKEDWIVQWAEDRLNQLKEKGFLSVAFKD